MRFTLIFILLANLTFAQSQFVNPFIGTGGYGHTFPGATVPFGMVQLSPDTRIDGSWDGCSGYHYSDSFVYGFSHTHLSGTGVSDYGDILLLPSTNPISFEPEEYKTKFSHNNEKAEANYYSVDLPANGVKVELTTSTWAGFHRYTFEENVGYVLLDLKHRDETLDFIIKERGNQSIDGYRISTSWAKEQHCYFSMEFNNEISEIEYNIDSSKALLFFKELKKNQLEVYVGLSFTGVEGAQKNLNYETGKTYEAVKFDDVVREGQAYWNKELSKIEVFTEDENKKNIFYTALYHSMIHPNIAEDVDGKYRGHDMKIHDSPNHTHYTVFSLWDTYRALHPLMTIIDERRTTDFINSFLEIYKQSGRLPVWELASNETDCMIGYHSVSVIADAYMKGIRGFDASLALEAMVASANEDIFGLDSYNKYGFIQVEDESESVSKTLEYSYDDWCIAQMARAMGEDSLANIFYHRAESWRNVINPKTGFATPRLKGDWLRNFDPKEVNLHFTEANSWQYSFVQHAKGGREVGIELEEKLDDFFSAKEETTGRTQSDITGLIGQYAHGNEPSHHIAYLYNYTDHPEKGHRIIKQICDSFYTNTPDGLIGNEDCGQMSAWYVFSSMGFYPTSPGESKYAVGRCMFDSVKIHFEGGEIFELTEGNSIGASSFEHWYIAGEPRSTLHYDMIPYKSSFVETPLISGTPLFEDSTSISVLSINSEDELIIKLGESESVNSSFTIEETTTINSRAKRKIYWGPHNDSFYVLSPEISATFYKKPNSWTCRPSLQPNSQYTGGGDDALIDGINGTVNWQAGRWQGYQHEEVTFDLDFKETKRIKEVSASFVQDARSWILMPTKVEVYLENRLIGSRSYDVDAFTEGTFLKNLSVKLEKEVKTDQLKVKVCSAGKLPPGHPGNTINGDAFFFIDEITIK